MRTMEINEVGCRVVGLGFKGVQGQVAILNSVLRKDLIENIFGPVVCFYEGEKGREET